MTATAHKSDHLWVMSAYCGKLFAVFIKIVAIAG
jgi:hypothetical protein